MYVHVHVHVHVGRQAGMIFDSVRAERHANWIPSTSPTLVRKWSEGSPFLC